MLALHDLSHAFFNSLQILGREIAWQIEIIIETIFYRRTDCNLPIGEHLQHSLRHDMRR